MMVGDKECDCWHCRMVRKAREHGKKKLVKEAYKKCKCRGTFVKPSSLGFDGDGILICDNEDRGDGQPCEEWIIDNS